MLIGRLMVFGVTPVEGIKVKALFAVSPVKSKLHSVTKKKMCETVQRMHEINYLQNLYTWKSAWTLSLLLKKTFNQDHPTTVSS